MTKLKVAIIQRYVQVPAAACDELRTRQGAAA